MLNPDFREILSAFEDSEIEYLVVGAYALAAHGFPRATGDLDIWIRTSEENVSAVFKSLIAFGAPLESLTEEELTEKDVVFQIGVSPCRIDILTSITGVSFDAAWPQRLRIEMDGVHVLVLGRNDLIENKKATARPQDLVDVEKLLRLK